MIIWTGATNPTISLTRYWLLTALSQIIIRALIVSSAKCRSSKIAYWELHRAAVVHTVPPRHFHSYSPENKALWIAVDHDDVIRWKHFSRYSGLLALSVGNSPVTSELPSQRPLTRSIAVFFDLLLNKGLSKQWMRRWFQAPSHSL